MRGGKIVAAVATFRRGAELTRLLQSLHQCESPPALVAIADHAPGGEVAAIAEKSCLSCIVLEDATNPGPGAGWSNAASAALAAVPDADAILFLDDDVVIPREAPGMLVDLMAQSGSGCMAPLLEDRTGRLWAFPEPAEPRLRKLIRQAATPADALRLLGDGPHAFNWCTGACILVSRQAYERTGPHRRDFFMLGEDLEFSMRAAATAGGAFTCAISVPHLPPEGTPDVSAAAVKFCALLQNLSYLAFHSRHSAHMKHYLPGNFRRFFRTFGITGRSLSDASRCFWAGAACGEPAGKKQGSALRTRIRSRMNNR